jgi:hypothetical protein
VVHHCDEVEAGLLGPPGQSRDVLEERIRCDIREREAGHVVSEERTHSSNLIQTREAVARSVRPAVATVSRRTLIDAAGWETDRQLHQAG